LGHSIFTPTIFKRNAKQLKVALQQQQLKPQVLESHTLWKSLYLNHPYGHPVSGTLATFPDLDLPKVKAFYQRYYVAQNAQIALVGAISRQQAERIANQLSQALPSGKVPNALPRPAVLKKASHQTIRFNSTQTYYALGQVGIRRGDPDYAALFVGNQLLGGSGFGSLLMTEVREKRGLVYSVYSYFAPMKEAGPFVIGLSTKNSTAIEADKVVRQTLTQFMHNFSDKKLQAIKDNLLNGFVMRMDSNAKMLGYISMIGFYHQRLDYLDWFPKQIEQVTKKQILTAWRHHIQPDKMVSVMVGQPK
jgi:zinc protease